MTDDDIQYYRDSLVAQGTVENQIMEGIATYGDAVNIDYVGYIDGEAFDGGNTQGAGTTITLGSSGYIDNFDEQIVGHSPGDAFDVEVTFPDDYGSTDLAGKDAVFETTLNYISESEEPEYDDVLVASLTDYSTVDEYESATWDDLVERYAESDESANKAAVIQKVYDGCNVTEYPEKEVQDRVEKTVSSITEQAEANGIDVDTYLSQYGYTLDTFKSTLKESVEEYIREKMIIVAIADKEGLTITDEEAEEEVQKLMEQAGVTDKETLSSMYGYEDDDYYYEALFVKVTDLIWENAVAVEATETDAVATDTDVEE